MGWEGEGEGRDTLMSTVSPRNNCNFSIVSILRATTELSSFTASSTMRRFGAFFRSKIAVEKSFFAAGFLHRQKGTSTFNTSEKNTLTSLDNRRRGRQVEASTTTEHDNPAKKLSIT
jgi:hypothetical protein